MSISRSWLAATAALALVGLEAAPAFAGWRTPAAGSTMSGDPEIILTFDDGPNPATTGKVLDILKAYHAKAIFFLVGERIDKGDTPKAKALIARMLREGHVVANHTTTHAQLCAVKEERAAWEIDASASSILGASGMATPWFRSPYGGFCKRLEAQLAARKITHMYWDIDAQEWRHNNAKRTVRYITFHVWRLQGRAVVLMHDTKTATVRALPQILDWLTRENRKRAESSRRQIKILDAPILATEYLAPGLVDWFQQAQVATLAAVDRATACVP